MFSPKNLKISVRPGLPPLEQAQVVFVQGNLYNGTFIRSAIRNGKPVFNRQPSSQGGWQLGFDNDSWQLSTTQSSTYAPEPGCDVRTWDQEKKLWVFDNPFNHLTEPSDPTILV